MPLGRPRRIFRSSPLAPVRSRRPRVIFGLLAAGLVGGGGVWLLAGVRLPSLPAFSGGGMLPAAHVAAEPAQIAVLDGDTLRLRDVVVRLRGITAPRRGESCRGADGAGFDCGAAATNALAEMVRAATVDCRLAGHDGMGRPLGVCEASGRQINRALVAAGYARAESGTGGSRSAGEDIGLQVADLRSDEDQARAHRRGLWAADHAASW